ncbi:MAG: MFS transporter [Bacteroidales bacterium]|nr:MFS transporter [Bacteroidales bacterium]
MAGSTKSFYRPAAWIALACLVVPMFASYYFDDMFSSISYLFENPSLTALGWDAAGYGLYTSGYSVLCVFGGLVIGGILLDKWGVRVSGSLFVGMMVLGAGMVTWAVLHGGAAALRLAYVGTMLFGLGSEIAGTAVTRSIARWFRGGPMALAMGLQLAIARLGTAFALVLSPRLVQQVPDHVYSLAETARPALVGMGLMALGLILWAVFVALDARSSRAEASDARQAQNNGKNVLNDGKSASMSTKNDEKRASQKDSEEFRFKDVLGVLGNKNFWMLGLLCVLFYSSIIAFKKFAGAILVPRFDIPAQAAGWMVSMLPFSTVVFAPLFGMMVDKAGKGTRWMVLGAILSLIAHAILAFAPAGVPFWGYLAMVFLGFGYSLVPAALWPSVPKIVPDKVLGTTFALIYWVQNLGLLSFKMIAGNILGAHSADTGGPVAVELMFLGLCIAALAVAFIFRRTSARHPELRLDAPNG